MDFSKIKKIFYIVAIISMLLSIKSKVLALTFNYNNVIYDNNTFNATEYPYFMVCLNTSKTYYNIIQTSEPITYTMESNNKYLRTYGISSTNTCYYYSMPIESFNTYDFTNYNNGSLRSSDFQFRFDNNSDNYVYSNYDVYVDGSGVHSADDSQYLHIDPFFANPEELQDAPKTVFIELGDYSSNDYLYFHLLEVTNIMPVSNNDSTYYYNDKIFALNKDSKYYTQLFDTTKYYYSIPRSALGLNPDTSYFYVLTSSNTQIDNSINPITEGGEIYDVIMQDTTGIITEDMATNDKLQNINQEFNEYQQQQKDFQQQQQDFQNQNSILPETETDINSSLNFNNQNNELNNLNNGFFSRLTNMLSNLLGYDLAEDTSVSLPLPNSNKNIVLHSIDIHNNVSGALRLIINAFWVYIFTFYLWKFINKIYISVSSGNILDSFSSSGEAITNDML